MRMNTDGELIFIKASKTGRAIRVGLTVPVFRAGIGNVPGLIVSVVEYPRYLLAYYILQPIQEAMVLNEEPR